MLRTKSHDRNVPQPRHEFIILALLYLAAVAVRFAVAARYPVKMRIIPDELRYYGIAASLFRGDGVTIYNYPSDFQKLAYTLLLVPAFAVRSLKARICFIFGINALVMNAGVFPVWYLSGQLLKKKRHRYLVCLSYLASPYLTFTASFMSENLYFPLVLTLMAVLWRIHFSGEEDSRGRRIFSWAGAGVLTYACYACKEIAIVFLPALAASIFCEALICRAQGSNRGGVLKKLRGQVAGFAVYTASFAAAYLLTKMAFFRGTGNSYDQMGIGALTAGNDRVAFMIFGFACQLVAVLLTCYGIPLILPIAYMDRLEKRAGVFGRFLLWVILASAAVVAYTITVREDYERVIPRAHMRYFAWCVPLFFLLLAHLCEQKTEDSHRERVLRLALITVFTCAVFLLYRGFYSEVFCDNNLWLMYGRSRNMQAAVCLVFALTILIVSAVFLRNRRRAMGIFLMICSVVGLYENYCAGSSFRSEYHVPASVARECEQISDYVRDHESDRFLFIEHTSEDGFFERDEMMETALVTGNVSYTRDGLLAGGDPDEFDVDLTARRIPVGWVYYAGQNFSYEPMEYQYCIVQRGLTMAESENCRLVKEISGSDFRVYRITDQKITVKKTGEKLVQGEE